MCQKANAQESAQKGSSVLEEPFVFMRTVFVNYGAVFRPGKGGPTANPFYILMRRRFVPGHKLHARLDKGPADPGHHQYRHRLQAL